MNIIDDYSAKVLVYFLKIKDEDEVFGHFKEWKTMDEKHTRNQVRSLKTENGIDFCKDSFNNFFKIEDIVRRHTV